MRLRRHNHALCLATAAVITGAALPALGQAVGGGGAAPPAIYATPGPTLAPNTRTQLRVNSNGALVTAPVTAQTTLPTHEQGTVPFAASTTLPTHEQGTVPISASTTIPTHEQGTVPFAASTTLPTHEQGIVPVTAVSPLPVNIQNQPTTQQINVSTTPLPTHENGTASVSFPTAQPVICSNCSGNGSSPQYLATPPAYTSGQTTTLQTDGNGNLKTVAATPLPLLPVTLSIPSPLPIYASTPLPVVFPTITPSLNGFGTQPGTYSHTQAFGFDGQNSNLWWPIEVEQYGVQVVSPGGTATNYYPAGGAGGDPVKQYPGRLVSIQNMSGSAQTATFRCYDNASTAAGNLLFYGVMPAYPNAGWQVILNTYAVNGIFCQPTAAVNSGGAIVIQYE